MLALCSTGDTSSLPPPWLSAPQTSLKRQSRTKAFNASLVRCVEPRNSRRVVSLKITRGTNLENWTKEGGGHIMRLSFPNDQEEGLWETVEGWELSMVISTYPHHLSSFHKPKPSPTCLASNTSSVSLEEIQTHHSKATNLHNQFFLLLRIIIPIFFSFPKWADFNGLFLLKPHKGFYQARLFLCSFVKSDIFEESLMLMVVWFIYLFFCTPGLLI